MGVDNSVNQIVGLLEGVASSGGVGGSAYAAAVLQDNPLLYYRFADTSGTTATDSSGNGRNGTYVSTVTLNQTGATTDGNKAVYCDPGGLPSITTGFAGWGSGRTWEVWVNKVNSFLNFDRGIFCGEGANSPSLFFPANFSGTILRWDPDQSVGGGSTDWTGLSIVGSFHHIVLTQSGTTAELWIDKISQGSRTVEAFGATPGNFTFSRRQAGGGFECLDSFFDEGAIYGTVLSSARIAAHFDAR